MKLDIGTGVALLLGIGFGGQWLAWRLRVSAILPLLLVGVCKRPSPLVCAQYPGWHVLDASVASMPRL